MASAAERAIYTPSPYSSAVKYATPVLLAYPGNLRQVFVFMTDRRYIHYVSQEYLRRCLSLVMGNYLPSSYSHPEIAQKCNTLIDKTLALQGMREEAEALQRPLTDQERLRLLIIKSDLDITMLNLPIFFEDVNKENFARYKKKGLHDFPAALLRAKRLETLACKFMDDFFPFTCYASDTQRITAIENAMTHGARLNTQTIITPEKDAKVFEFRVCLGYYEMRRKHAPWDGGKYVTGVGLSHIPYINWWNVEDMKREGRYEEYGERLLRVREPGPPNKPFLLNILLEIDEAVRVPLAVAFASVTHRRLGASSALHPLEPALVVRIMELAGYYAEAPAL